MAPSFLCPSRLESFDLLVSRARILVSLGIKLFLLVAIPWGAACEEVQVFFRHITKS